MVSLAADTRVVVALLEDFQEVEASGVDFLAVEASLVGADFQVVDTMDIMDIADKPRGDVGSQGGNEVGGFKGWYCASRNYANSGPLLSLLEQTFSRECFTSESFPDLVLINNELFTSSSGAAEGNKISTAAADDDDDDNDDDDDDDDDALSSANSVQNKPRLSHNHYQVLRPLEHRANLLYKWKKQSSQSRKIQQLYKSV
ncbi:uncharacterized protein [Cherax quadricarinatus]|uniref:uncharacterized protein n=1 Tax=Cherax quadricarinatus TaxID=27406 RepID=UPI00387E29D6